MRRFVESLPGRAVCHAVVTALVLPFLSLVTATRAQAQIQTLPSWAVVDFVNRSPGDKGGFKIGALAADAVANELSKSGRYDVTPREQVARAIQSLNLVTPVTEHTSLMRLATEVSATSLVTGEVVNWQIRPAGNGKQADVIVRAIVRDVASGLPVNGSAQSASSSLRPGDTPDEVLLAEAFSLAASKIVGDVSNRSLPRGTVLNTFENQAFVNQGSRSGFKVGQQVIVYRGSEQVATARVIQVSYDDSTAEIVRSFKGMKPGDRVQVVFEVPNIEPGFFNDGSTKQVRPKVARSNTGFLQMLGAVFILAALMGGKNANKQIIVAGVKAEAQNDFLTPGPAVKVTFGTNFLVRGNNQKFQFQVYRSDVIGTPVLVAAGSARNVLDTTAERTITYDTAPRTDVNLCQSGPTVLGPVTQPGIVPGTPYLYAVELVYKIGGKDFPEPQLTDCYFLSDQTQAPGPATPLNKPELVAPADNLQLAADTPIPFTFNSVLGATPLNIQYVLQLSTQPSFPKSQTETIGPILSNSGSTVSMGVIDTLNGRKGFIQDATTLFWRIGARNIADNPGPVPDASGQRYIFSDPRTFTRPNTPPPPPSS